MQPLADRIRPRELQEIVGQEHVLGPDGTLAAWLELRAIAKSVAVGLPGCGKTTLARLLAERVIAISTVVSGAGRRG